MSVQFDSSRNCWVVRWYEAGRQRSRRFADEQAAPVPFDAEQRAAKRRWHGKDSEAALVGELAQLRARAQTIEDQLPADAQAHGRLLLRDEAGRPLAGRRQSAGRDGHDTSRLSQAMRRRLAHATGSRSRGCLEVTCHLPVSVRALVLSDTPEVWRDRRSAAAVGVSSGRARTRRSTAGVR